MDASEEKPETPVEISNQHDQIAEEDVLEAIEVEDGKPKSISALA